LTDRLRARRLVDADRPDASVGLFEHIAANPANVVGHLPVPDILRAPGRDAELVSVRPTAATQDHVGVHPFLLLSAGVPALGVSQTTTVGQPYPRERRRRRTSNGRPS